MPPENQLNILGGIMGTFLSMAIALFIMFSVAGILGI